MAGLLSAYGSIAASLLEFLKGPSWNKGDNVLPAAEQDTTASIPHSCFLCLGNYIELTTNG